MAKPAKYEVSGMRDEYARAAHPGSRPVAHQWGDPMPGSGRMRICMKCGTKELGSSSDPEHPNYSCSGIEPVAHGMTDAEYDPIP